MNKAITFMDEDVERVHHPYDDAIVITLLIADYMTIGVQWKFGKYLVLSCISANEAWTRSTSSSEFAFDKVWKNESATCRHHYITCGSGGIPTTDSQRRKFPCGRLFILLYCHNRKANFK